MKQRKTSQSWPLRNVDANPYSFVNPSITKRRVEGVRRFRVAGMTGEEGWRIDCVILKHGSALDAGSGVVQPSGCISNVAFVNMQPGGCT